MYNLGQAASSGNLVSRGPDGMAIPFGASNSAATGNQYASAADAPFLTNVEQHLGRMTLTAPDNMRRKQAKEKKQKAKQKKAQNAHLAAAALAGINPASIDPNTGLPLDDNGAGPSALRRPGMQRGISSGYSSGGNSGTLGAAAASGGVAAGPAPRTRRRPASNPRSGLSAGDDDSQSSRPASRNTVGRTREEELRPPPSTSQARSTTTTTTSSPSRSRQPSSEEVRRVRSGSAPSSTTELANLAANTGGQPLSQTSGINQSDEASISSAYAQQASLRRYNIWNDIAGLPGADEPDPDDLPPPFPEGATRPPDPPQPPPIGEGELSAEQRLEIERRPIPNSPPPAFRTDPESDGGDEPRRSPTASNHQRRATQARRSADEDGSLSESSASEPDLVAISDERRAWEEDVRAGLSFEERILREQERREARERAILVSRAAPSAMVTSAAQDLDQPDVDGPPMDERATEAHDEQVVDQPADDELSDGNDLEFENAESELPSSAHPSPPTAPRDITVPTQPLAVENDEETIAATAGDGDNIPPTDASALTHEIEAEQDLVVHESDVPENAPTEVVSTPQTETEVQPAEHFVEFSQAQPHGTQLAAEAENVVPSGQSVSGQRAGAATEGMPAEAQVPRQTLFNETRLGLPPFEIPRDGPSSIPSRAKGTGNAGPSTSHRRTASDHLSGKPSTDAHDQRVRTVRLGARQRPASESYRHVDGNVTFGTRHASRFHETPARRPEETLVTVSAPPAASTSSHAGTRPSVNERLTQAVEGTKSPAFSSDSSEDDAIAAVEVHSDSSTEQWLAEAAAFDALRKREEAAAARLQKLRISAASNGGAIDSSDDESDPRPPGDFPPARPSPARASPPDLSRLASMKSTVPRAPPPLVLGRSRGGAAYSSSSASSDTDAEAVESSSSEEADPDTLIVNRWPKQAYESDGSALSRNTSLASRSSQSKPEKSITPATSGLSTSNQPANTSLQRSVHARSDLREGSSSNGLSRAASAASTSSMPERLGASAPTNVAPAKDDPDRLVAKGKQPERPRTADQVLVPVSLRMAQEEERDSRAGIFQQDDSSSRDVSSADEQLSKQAKAPQSLPVDRQGHSVRATETSVPMRRKSSDSYSKALPAPPTGPATPVTGALGASSNKPGISTRLRGLFGTPLVDTGAQSSEKPTGAEASEKLTSDSESSKSILSQAQLPSTLERAASLNRRSSGKSFSSIDKPERSRRTSQTGPSLQRKVSAEEKHRDVQRKASVSSLRSVNSAAVRPAPSQQEQAASSSKLTQPPEERARNQALSQIAQLQSTPAAPTDSLAALERLLARTSRPVSMGPLGQSLPSTEDASAPQPYRLTSTVGLSAQNHPSDNVSSTWPDEPYPLSGTPHASSASGVRLSRQGAIARNRREGPPPPPPVSYNMRPSSRPASFVNPRSGNAPLPRGRLPTITDATRHFPPSRSSTINAPTPGWMSHIPSSERSRLPEPLQPERLSGGAARQEPSSSDTLTGSTYDRSSEIPMPVPARGTGSRVSAMVSRFENAGDAASSSSGQIERSTSSDRPLSWQTSAQGNTGTMSTSHDLAKRRSISPSKFSSTIHGSPSSSLGSSQGPASTTSFQREDTLGRRPPPPPPAGTLPRSRPLPVPMSSIPTPGSERDSSLMPPPQWPSSESRRSWENNGTASMQAGISRSPRTLAMDTLTQRDTNPFRAPAVPPKSPVPPPEELFRSTRNGLGQSLAAAQAATSARRENRRAESIQRNEAGYDRNNGHDSHMSAAPQGRPTVGLFGQPYVAGDLISFEDSARIGPTPGPSNAREGSRPLPTLPSSLRDWSSNGAALTGSGSDSHRAGLGIAAPLPVPPLLPERPRGRVWEDLPRTGSGPSRAELPDAHFAPSTASGGLKRRQDGELNGSEDRDEDDDEDDDADADGDSGVEAAVQDEVESELSATNLFSAAASAVGADELSRTISMRSRLGPTTGRLQRTAAPPLPRSQAQTNAASTSTNANTGASASTGTSTGPGAGLTRSNSIWVTDLDLLVSQLEAEGSHYEQLAAIGEFLGPAKPTKATAEELSTLVVGKVECERRRRTKEGKIKQKLSVVGVRVDKCAICLAQFKEGAFACVFPCVHM